MNGQSPAEPKSHTESAREGVAHALGKQSQRILSSVFMDDPAPRKAVFNRRVASEIRKHPRIQNGSGRDGLDHHDRTQPGVDGDCESRLYHGSGDRWFRAKPLIANKQTNLMQRDNGAISLILLAAALLTGVLMISDRALSDSHSRSQASDAIEWHTGSD